MSAFKFTFLLIIGLFSLLLIVLRSHKHHICESFVDQTLPYDNFIRPILTETLTASIGCFCYGFALVASFTYVEVND